MIAIDVSKAVNDITAQLGDLARNQVPFAASVALNRTAESVQKREVHEMKDVFNKPTPYTLSSTYIKRASKRELQATVGLKEFSGKGIPATKFLAPQITGGSRRMKRFEKALRAVGKLPEDYLAVPGSGAQLDAYGNIKPSQIVEILSYFRAFPEAGYRANMTDKTRARKAKGTKSKRGYAYFIGRPGRGRGPLGVWQRVSFGFGSALKPVLIFIRGAQYEQTLDFAFVATTTIEREFPEHFEAALRSAVATAR